MLWHPIASGGGAVVMRTIIRTVTMVAREVAAAVWALLVRLFVLGLVGVSDAVVGAVRLD